MQEIKLEIFKAVSVSFQNQTAEEDDVNTEPLVARIFDLSQTGNLTIIFSRPIILPPIKIEEIDQGRMLQSEGDNSLSKQKPLTI